MRARRLRAQSFCSLLRTGRHSSLRRRQARDVRQAVRLLALPSPLIAPQIPPELRLARLPPRLREHADAAHLRRPRAVQRLRRQRHVSERSEVRRREPDLRRLQRPRQPVLHRRPELLLLPLRRRRLLRHGARSGRLVALTESGHAAVPHGQRGARRLGQVDARRAAEGRLPAVAQRRQLDRDVEVHRVECADDEPLGQRSVLG